MLASATKSNALQHAMVLWDEVVAGVAKEFPHVELKKYHVDALCARMVTHPHTLDVIVASNLFGDILTDIGSAISGSLGVAPAATSTPIARRRRCSSRSTARRPTSRARASRTRSRRSGRGDDARSPRRARGARPHADVDRERAVRRAREDARPRWPRDDGRHDQGRCCARCPRAVSRRSAPTRLRAYWYEIDADSPAKRSSWFDYWQG
jgi:hypothetical protein